MHLLIAVAFFRFHLNHPLMILSEKVANAIYAFLDMHTLLANYGLFCLADMLLSSIFMIELGNFHPNPSSFSTPSFGYASWGGCPDI